MDDFVCRQTDLILAKVGDFRRGALSLSALIQQVEGLSHAIGEQFWSDKVFPIALDLERVNSELIDKRRLPTTEELKFIEQCLSELELLARGISPGRHS